MTRDTQEYGSTFPDKAYFDVRALVFFRLSLKHAAYIMGAGWTFSILMAALPLFGVSDYRKFAVCLPFETGDPVSLGYVVFLMLINGVAFSILMGCYLKMYCAIRGSQAWNSNDSR